MADTFESMERNRRNREVAAYERIAAALEQLVAHFAPEQTPAPPPAPPPPEVTTNEQPSSETDNG